jgi:hypothetical protein
VAITKTQKPETRKRIKKGWKPEKKKRAKNPENVGNRKKLK